MNTISTTKSGYKIVAINPDESSPMENHKGGEIAVDEENKTMYVHGVFVACYGTDSIMKACESY